MRLSGVNCWFVANDLNLINKGRELTWLAKAFNVFIGTAALTELISFSFPAALLMWQRRDPKYLPAKSPFNLGKFGWLVNATVLAWTAFALVIFSFPVTLPVAAGSMSKLKAV